VLGVVQRGRRYPAAPQLRERSIIVFAGTFDIHDGVASDAALASQF
jgi:hypothetical protein